MTEIPTGGRKAVPGDRARPVLPSAAGCGHRAASGRRAGACGDRDGGRGPRRRRVHQRVIFHTVARATPPRSSPACAGDWASASPWVGSAPASTAAAEAFFSSLKWEVLSRHDFPTTAQARATVIDWCYGLDNHQRRHSAAAGQSPIKLREHRPQPRSGDEHRRHQRPAGPGLGDGLGGWGGLGGSSRVWVIMSA
jgi:putative transposase